MTRGRIVLSFLVLLSTSFLFPLRAAQDLAVVVNQAHGHVLRREFVDAINLLLPAEQQARMLPNPAERDQALSAIHFYLAAAYTGTNDRVTASKHLREFFRLSPNSNRIDPTKYDRDFVALFNELSPAHAQLQDAFETYYPRFASFVAEPGPSLTAGAWGGSPALEILATTTEKKQWQSLPGTDDRVRFIKEFWQRRDPSPSTSENEFREMFDRRVAYADDVFGTAEQRGALTDRGRVFILLGEPSFVRRRPIKREDQVGRNRVWVPDDSMINGTIEQWIYTREQLPIRLVKPSVTYRFVTQPGLGIGLLQREDAFALQALDAAANPNTVR